MKKMLIVVDMLNDFINPDGALYCGPTATAIVPNVYGRVQEYREAGLAITFLADSHSKHDLEFTKFPEHCVAGTDGADIIKELKRPGMSIVTKTRYSGFYNTALDKVLSEFKMIPGDSVIEVCGVCTSICVLMTTADLANRDFNVVIHRNCVADFDQEAHNFSLGYMERILGATII